MDDKDKPILTLVSDQSESEAGNQKCDLGLLWVAVPEMDDVSVWAAMGVYEHVGVWRTI